MNSVDVRTMEYEKVYAFLMDQLEHHLPQYLSYHNADHTKMVIAAAEKLADGEGLTEEQTVLLKTAALFHDAGFLSTYLNHEEASCTIAKENLPQFGYTPAQVNDICRIIRTTKLP